MELDIPAYYTELNPFRALFDTGVPILTYHKLGPRPVRVRLKGMYLSASLFLRQLSELRAAGFSSVGGLPMVRDGNARKPIGLSFDDGFASVHRYGLGPLANNGFRAVQFLVADLIGRSNEWDRQVGEAEAPLMDRGQVREWLLAGHEIGSHTLTHPFLTRIGIGQAKEEISASKKKLEDIFGIAVRHFCYPYGDWNPEIRDLVMEAGYEAACTTEFGVNTGMSDRFTLKRITARYRSRGLKGLTAKLRRLRAQRKAYNCLL
jgi:peptidoglycan/xylan/chitin deacetylase (PgdA/CDA1 family)